MGPDQRTPAGQPFGVMDLAAAVFRCVDAPTSDEPASLEHLVGAVDRTITDAFILLRRDPAAAGDDPELIGQAVILGRAVHAGEYSARAGRIDLDAVLAWVRYADAASQRLYGVGSGEAISAAEVLVQLLAGRRAFDEALTVQHRVAVASLQQRDAWPGVLAAVRTAELLQCVGRCAEAVDVLTALWRGWQQRHPRGNNRRDLKVIMPLVVMLAVCGRTTTALRRLAEAEPYRPTDPTRDLVDVWFRYGTTIAPRRAEHAPHCAWPTADPDTDLASVLRP
ncbi:hypothetical protein AB0H83_23310 [Dactylosporangium sp. NPDC050688]|uniref:hypothetical protein n=1 Tax=Dactylosporangium sp. NPDC050688 TaxID=3157217 RepID=UPI0033E76301